MPTDVPGAVLVANTLKPLNGQQYPVALAEDVAGGYQTFLTTAERDAFDARKLVLHMLCYVAQTSKTFRLTSLSPVVWTEEAGGGGTGAVSSVNGATGDVVLNAGDVGADPAGTASVALADHVAATDPHGDRAYADSLIIEGDFFDESGSDSWGLPASGVTVGTTAVTVNLPADAADLFPFICYADIVITDVALDVTTAIASSSAEIGIYAATRNPSGGYTIGSLIESFGTIDTSTVGFKQISGLSRALVKGEAYAIAWVTDTSSLIVRAHPYVQPVMRLRRSGSASSWARRVNYNVVTASFPLPATLGAAPVKSFTYTTSPYWLHPVLLKWTP